MSDEPVTITTATTKKQLIGYIDHPCITNWKNLAKKEQEGTPVKNGGICGKCMFRGFLEQYMVKNEDASTKIQNFMKVVRANPKMYPRIAALLK